MMHSDELLPGDLVTSDVRTHLWLEPPKLDSVSVGFLEPGSLAVVISWADIRFEHTRPETYVLVLVVSAPGARLGWIWRGHLQKVVAGAREGA